MLDIIALLLTGAATAFLLWKFWGRYSKKKALYDIYYMMGFAVLLVSGVLLIVLGLGILKSPYVLTVATLIPLGISMGLMEQYLRKYKKVFKWFALLGFIAIAASAIGGLDLVKKISVPLFHGVAGLVIFLLPFFTAGKQAVKDFWWVGIGGGLIGLGGIALAFISSGSQLLFFSPSFVMLILTPLLFLMTLAFTYGFTKDLQK